ncbi:hypothetical protein JCM10207_008338 [Rhodosporidiobolus poonsookiae]
MLVFALDALATRASARIPPLVPDVAPSALGFILVLLLLILHPRTPPIQLPTTTSAAYVSDSKPHEPERDRDVDEERFYARLRKHKLWTAVATVGGLTTELFALGWMAVGGAGRVGWQTWVGQASGIVFWSICAGIALLSLPLSNAPRALAAHWRYTLTLFALTSLALFLTLLRLLLPRSTGLSLLPPPSLPSPEIHLARSLLGARCFLQLASFSLAGSTDRRAPQAHPQTGRPILSLFSTSPLTYLLFGWITPVLRSAYRGRSDERSLDESALPALPASERAVNVWEEVKQTERFMRKENVPKGWNALLWRIVRANRTLFIWQASLSVLNAGLYYLPAFFLQRVVAFLETRNERAAAGDTSLQWGYVYCVGLLVSAVVESLVSGQLWFISNSLLATRIRVQLNALLFDKTLKRKDLSGVSAAAHGSKSSAPTPAGSDAGSDDSEEDEEEAEDGGGFKKKSAITNLFSVDADRVADFAVWSFSVYDAPVEILIGITFLYQLIGYAALIGVSVAVFFLPLNNWTSKGFAVTQDKLMNTRDRRVTMMNEVLNSIRMIKFYAFEKPFEEKILKARSDELKQLRWNFWLEVSFQAIWSVSPILCVLVSFWAYTSPLLMNRELTPSVAFASLAVWNELEFSLNVIPDVLQSALQCLVSLRRIEAYLRLPEIEHLALPSSTPDTILVNEPQAEEPPVAFRKATVTWPKDDAAIKAVEENGEEVPKSFELQEVDVEFPKGELSLICGRLGSGKTLMLLSLLGETDVLSGTISCPRSSPTAIALPSLDWDAHLTDANWIAPNQTAFVPQQAWLQNATVRENIIFGLPFREDRYKAVLEACSLLSDLAILEDGSDTEIGEKGINLSGGQKARVSLARAVYSRASLLLLDDVISAVDAHTAAHIFEKCLKGPLLEGRTVVLVSHHVQLTAPGAAYVVELDNGRVGFSGTGADYLKSESFTAISGGGDDEPTSPKLENKPLPAPSSSPTKPSKPVNKTFAAVVAESTPASNASSTEVSSASDSEGESDSDSEEQDPTIDGPASSAKNGKTPAAGAPEKEKKPRKLIEEEGRAVGHVEWSVWRMYLGLLGGWVFWMAFAAIFGGAKLTNVAQTWWLGKWAGGADGSHGLSYYLGIYAVLSLLAVFVDTAQWFVLYFGTLRASYKIHEMLLHSILRAPLRFFDTQALGRIQNRFAKDLEQIDSSLPDHVGRSILYGLGVLTTLVIIATTAPTFLLGFAVLSLAYWQYARLFSYSSREFRRLDSVTKSPLFSIYGEAIGGVAIIRSFGASARFMSLMLERTTRNVTFFFYLWGTNRWLSMRFSLLSSIVLALAGYVLISAGDKVDAALAGFTLTFTLNISNELLFLVRRYTQLELAMVGVERVKEFSELKQEAPEIVEPRPPAVWPHAGAIEVRELNIKYAPELPSVLHDISFSIKAGEKIGIVGATGCGKSTLASSFFRFVEAHSGSIVVDGIDISKIGLFDLRSRLTIVPQDPVILSGSLRSTLDMFGQYDDHEIFDALRRVHLIKEGENPIDQEAGANRSVFWNLDAEVAEGGTNFSTGQRQLLCMARALLRRNKILLLDEATASTDHETDELITQTIRSEFADSTLLVIAHRLRTIIDFNKILLLDKGKVLEYDSPATLLEDPTSRFYALCRAAGKKELAILKKMSKGKARVTHKPRKLVRRSTTHKTLKPSGDGTA